MRTIHMVLIMSLTVGTVALAGERPRDPWVFRCVLDEQPRMVVLALHESLWVAYDATTCSLYKAWRGDVNMQGAVYTTVHGPQPVIRGDTVMNGVDTDIWSVSRSEAGNELIKCTAVWKGYRIADSQVTLQYELQLPDGTAIKVQEQVDVHQDHDQQVRLVRVFHTQSVPADTTVAVSLSRYQTNQKPLTVLVNGRAVENIDPAAPGQQVALRSNESTTVEVALHVPAKAASSPAADMGNKQ